ncbi:MAG: hypothetical protein GY742_15975 [Hyphomicrobiales bacterium]|nr:hypothetical protein [Hyphomicrobiales bacterium]
MTKFGKSGKPLSPDDKEIWRRITKTAKPLTEEEKNYLNIFKEYSNSDWSVQPQPTPLPVDRLQSGSAAVYQPIIQKKPGLSASPLDSITIRKISRGKISIDGRLDLHGFQQQEARQILFNYIENAYYAEKRTILVITGKGNLGRGVLRENVPKWLAGASFRQLISGFAESHSSHGGAGAVYVKIRRKR